MSSKGLMPLYSPREQVTGLFKNEVLLLYRRDASHSGLSKK
jgi:hypothetical protein